VSNELPPTRSEFEDLEKEHREVQKAVISMDAILEYHEQERRKPKYWGAWATIAIAAFTVLGLIVDMALLDPIERRITNIEKSLVQFEEAIEE